MEAQETKTKRKRFAPGDTDILVSFRLNPVQTYNQVAASVGRTYGAIKRRMQFLRSEGLVNTMAQPSESAEVINSGDKMNFLTWRGWHWLEKHGYGTPPAGFSLATLPKRKTPLGVEIKTNKNAKHDLDLTALYLLIRDAFKKAGWKLEVWERLPFFIHAAVGKRDIRPDALFVFSTPEIKKAVCFIERERSAPNWHEDENSIETKARVYEDFARSGFFEQRWGVPVFRVLFVMRTNQVSVNQCARMSQKDRMFNSLRWFFTPRSDMENPTGSIFISPPDYESNRHSLIG